MAEESAFDVPVADCSAAVGRIRVEVSEGSVPSKELDGKICDAVLAMRVVVDSEEVCSIVRDALLVASDEE